MHTRGLTVLLGLCAMLGIAPVVPWALASVVDALPTAWEGALGALVVTVPLAFALAAIVLVVHGLLLQETMVDQFADDYARHRHEALVADPSIAGSNGAGTSPGTPAEAAAAAPASVAAVGEQPKPAKLGGKMAVVDRPPGFGDPSSKQSSKAEGVKRLGRRNKHRVTGMARRWFRQNFRL
jgi:hypothetical protein